MIKKFLYFVLIVSIVTAGYNCQDDDDEKE